MRARHLLPVMLVALAGCGEPGPDGIGIGDAAGGSDASLPPRVDLSATTLDFGSVEGASELPLVVTNTGGRRLSVTEVQLAGAPGFGLGPVPFVLKPGASRTMSATFTPQTASTVVATAVIQTNDPYHPSGVHVTLTGSSLPCLRAKPTSLNLGSVVIGGHRTVPLTLESCSPAAVNVLSLSWKEGSSPAFSTEAEVPFLVPAAGSIDVPVRFVPVTDGTAQGVLRITPETGDALEVFVNGYGSSEPCPTAVIAVEEGQEVIPQTNLHLDGTSSFGANGGTIANWLWTVTQPTGSASVFVPSSTFPNPTFETNVAGTYVFQLKVWDGDGLMSCLPAESTVVVVPDEGLHVELLWSTPGDADETDVGPKLGADLDLHFAHGQFASQIDLDEDGEPDPWFDLTFDCFWFNTNPNWGELTADIDDDPSLDRDDTDGAGPENLNFSFPEEGTYRIGVHYWADHGFGDSLATVRVYINGLKVFEQADVKLTDRDLWDVGTLHWPSGQVTGFDPPKITPSYNNPYFYTPE